MTPLTCPTHHKPLIVVTWCPACRGAQGGKARSSKKTRAARRNAAKPRPRTPRPPP
jgi:hypothetical protein